MRQSCKFVTLVLIWFGGSICLTSTAASFAQDYVLTAKAIDASSRVLGDHNGRQLIDGQSLVYISGEHADTHWQLYRVMTKVNHGEQEVFAIKKIASAQLVFTHQGVSALRISAQNREILAGDIALPQTEKVNEQ